MATLRFTDALDLRGGLVAGDGVSTHVRLSTVEAYAGVGTATTGAPRIVLGSNTPIAPQDDSCILICRKLQGTSLFSHAIRDESTFSSTLDSAYCSFDSAASMSGATAYNHLRSFQSRLTYSGSTSLGMANGFSWNFAHTGTGTVALAYGLYVQNPTGTGPITQLVGIWIDPLTRGGTSNFSIFSQSTTLQGYHGGLWHVGTGGLQVDGGGAAITGTVTVTGSLSTSTGLVVTGGSFSTSAGVTVTFNNGVHAQCLTAKGTVDAFDSAGGVVMQYLGGGTSSIRPYANSGGTGGVSLAVDLNGTVAATFLSTGLTLPAASVLTIGTNQVVNARKTGYTAMTGTPDKATAYATSTVTLAQLAGRIMQLQADLTTHGLIGA